MLTKNDKVLIIDDSPEVLSTMKAFVDKLGCRAFVSTSGEEGLALARVHRFKVVIIDIGLPEMAGDEVMAKMREVFTNTPIIMITGSDDEERAKKCMEIGAYDYIRKPFDFEYLKTSVLSTILSS